MKKLIISALCSGFFALLSAQPYCHVNLQYRQPITVNNTLGTLSNFQVKLTINTSALVSAGKMKSNGDDIRITDGSCNDLPYFIESGMNTSSTIIWIKPTSIVNGNNTYYMYYSDPLNIYSSFSNAANVFDFIDDFNGSGLSGAWSTEISGGTISVSGGAVSFSNSTYALAVSTTTYNYPIWTEAKFNSASGNWPSIHQFANGAGQVCGLFNSFGATMHYGTNSPSAVGRTCTYGGSTTGGTLAGIWSLGWNATNDAKFNWPSGSYTLPSTPTKPSAVQIGIGNLNGGTAASQVDWIRVRKYATTDPSVSLGTEVLNYDMDGVNVLDGFSGTAKTSFCGGDFAVFNSKFWLQLGASGGLYVELSDGSGSFSSPTTIASYPSQPYYGFGSSTPFAWFGFNMPNNLPYGTGYRLRWRLVDRAYTGAPTPAFTLGALPTTTNFSINNAAQCNETDNFTFTASGSIASGNTLTRNWNFGDTTTATGSPVSHGYAYAGTKTVTLKAYNASLSKCSADVVKTVIVHPQPVAYIQDYSWNNCPKIDHYFDVNPSYVQTGSLSSYDWNFGDNTTGSGYQVYHQYSTFGNYTVRMITTSDKGCKDTATVNHIVYPLPVVNFTNDLACDGHEVQFKDLTTVNSFGNSKLDPGYQYYQFADGSESYDKNPKHLYSTTGTYSVLHTVQTNRGCQDTIRKTIIVNPSPKASFTATNSCLDAAPTLANLSSISAGTLTYKWNLGNGTFSTAQTPAPTYAQSGSYNIRLIATANTGCTDSTNKDIVIYSMPVAQFSATEECLGTPTEFTNYSVDAASNLWNFGGGNTSTSMNPTYTYPGPGNNNVTLTVTSPNGCINSITKTVTTNDVPVAGFNTTTPTTCLTGHNFTMNNTSSISSGSYTNEWTFGDNTFSKSAAPTKTYAAAGDYTITLVNTSDKGCVSVPVSKLVSVSPMPVITFSFNNSCEKTSVQFLNNSTVSNGGSFGNFTWNFGDATSSAVANPTHTYNSSGNYLVTLEGTTDKGCKGTNSATYTAWPNPTVSFTSDNVCLGLENKFTNTSGVGTGFMASYDWAFGDGQTSAEISPMHTYASAGTYSVSLKGTTDKGCFATSSGNASVWPKPVANFTVANVCQGLASTFNNTSNVSSGSIATNAWTFGDGSTASSVSPSHTYTSFGNYMVNLTVKSDKNCESSITKEAKVFRQPQANIYASTLKTSVLDPMVSFSDNSLFGDYSNWNFGFNGRNSTNSTDTCTYTKPGTYKVVLVSSTVDACSDADSVNVLVENGYTLYFPNAFTPNTDNLNDAFGAVGIFSGITSFSLNVIDSRGRVLFTTTDINKKWNGKLDGSDEVLQAGNYAWFAEYTDFTGKKRSENGVVSIRK
ncbi:MAG: DUF2341 domain-containing protein [Bacteroidia bacterium]|nr:DUF2341 domain-containing protein [Bacteroidia bacterium]